MEIIRSHHLRKPDQREIDENSTFFPMYNSLMIEKRAREAFQLLGYFVKDCKENPTDFTRPINKRMDQIDYLLFQNIGVSGSYMFIASVLALIFKKIIGHAHVSYALGFFALTHLFSLVHGLIRSFQVCHRPCRIEVDLTNVDYRNQSLDADKWRTLFLCSKNEAKDIFFVMEPLDLQNPVDKIFKNVVLYLDDQFSHPFLFKDNHEILSDKVSLFIKSLLNQGAKVDASDRRVEDLFFKVKDRSLMRCLLDNLADVNEPCKSGDTLLHWAASESNLEPRAVEKMELLIKRGANVNASNLKGFTPFYYAICGYGTNHNVVGKVKLLISKGVDVNQPSPYKDGPKHYIRYGEQAEGLMQILINNGANITIRVPLKTILVFREPRIEPASNYWIDKYYGAFIEVQILEKLIRNGLVSKKCLESIDFDVETDLGFFSGEGRTLLHFACMVSRASFYTEKNWLIVGSEALAELEDKLKKLVSRLLNDGASVNEEDVKGRTPLHTAGYVSTVEALLAKGADPNKRDCEGMTPLHYYAQDVTRRYGNEHLDKIRLLLERRRAPR